VFGVISWESTARGYEVGDFERIYTDGMGEF